VCQWEGITDKLGMSFTKSGVSTFGYNPHTDEVKVMVPCDFTGCNSDCTGTNLAW
jgi:hypothetical protein